MPFGTIFSHSRSEHFWKQNYIQHFFSNHVNIRLNSQNSGSPCVHSTERKNATPLFFYYVYAALWRFDMHDILLDCQLLLLWFLVSSTATTNYYFAWNYTLWKISKRQLFFPYLSLSLFIDDYTKFVQQMTPGRFMTRKNAIKTFYVQLRALSTIPK